MVWFPRRFSASGKNANSNHNFFATAIETCHFENMLYDSGWSSLGKRKSWNWEKRFSENMASCLEIFSIKVCTKWVEILYIEIHFRSRQTFHDNLYLIKIYTTYIHSLQSLFNIYLYMCYIYLPNMHVGCVLYLRVHVHLYTRLNNKKCPQKWNWNSIDKINNFNRLTAQKREAKCIANI